MSSKLERFAWPGGYSIVYLDEKRGDTLCPECAEEELTGEDPPKFIPFVHWEGPDEYCAGCNKVLPSEYGDPDAGKES